MTLFIILHCAICIFLVGVILLQPGKADAGIGFGSSSQSIFGSKGAGNFLTKTTTVAAVLYLLTSFFLTRSRIQQYSSSVIKNEPAANRPVTPPPAGAVPMVPKASAPAAGQAAPANPAPAKK